MSEDVQKRRLPLAYLGKRARMVLQAEYAASPGAGERQVFQRHLRKRIGGNDVQVRPGTRSVEASVEAPVGGSVEEGLTCSRPFKKVRVDTS